MSHGSISQWNCCRCFVRACGAFCTAIVWLVYRERKIENVSRLLDRSDECIYIMRRFTCVAWCAWFDATADRNLRFSMIPIQCSHHGEGSEESPLWWLIVTHNRKKDSFPLKFIPVLTHESSFACLAKQASEKHVSGIPFICNRLDQVSSKLDPIADRLCLLHGCRTAYHCS